ncbi:hypothetical protein OK016_21075 [Vibrio chagasii]|nr:hypothetical protein [Vibrio chagasii]
MVAISPFSTSMKASQTLSIKSNSRTLSSVTYVFEWKTYSTDIPTNISAVLLENGFEQDEHESFMVLDLSKATCDPFDEGKITEVADSKAFAMQSKFKSKFGVVIFEWHYNHLVSLKQQAPDSVSIYVVYVDDQPVTSAWIIFNGNSPFAGIWGGSTIRSISR